MEIKSNKPKYEIKKKEAKWHMGTFRRRAMVTENKDQCWRKQLNDGKCSGTYKEEHKTEKRKSQKVHTKTEKEERHC